MVQALGLWQGIYQRIDRLWLRWYDVNGNSIPTPAERLAAKLRKLGINPDEL